MLDGESAVAAGAVHERVFDVDPKLFVGAADDFASPLLGFCGVAEAGEAGADAVDHHPDVDMRHVFDPWTPETVEVGGGGSGRFQFAAAVGVPFGVEADGVEDFEIPLLGFDELGEFIGGDDPLRGGVLDAVRVGLVWDVIAEECGAVAKCGDQLAAELDRFGGKPDGERFFGIVVAEIGGDEEIAEDDVDVLLFGGAEDGAERIAVLGGVEEGKSIVGEKGAVGLGFRVPDGGIVYEDGVHAGVFDAGNFGGELGVGPVLKAGLADLPEGAGGERGGGGLGVDRGEAERGKGDEEAEEVAVESR